MGLSLLMFAIGLVVGHSVGMRSGRIHTEALQPLLLREHVLLHGKCPVCDSCYGSEGRNSVTHGETQIIADREES